MNTLFGNQSIAPFFFIRKYSVFSCSARWNYAVFMDFIDSLAAISFPPPQVYSLFVSFSTLLEVIEQVYYSVLPTVSGKLGTYQYAGPFFTGKVCFVKEGFRMKNAYQIKLNELKNCQKPFITPNEAAGILGCDPNYIRVAAKQQTETGKQYLGFPVIRIATARKSRAKRS